MTNYKFFYLSNQNCFYLIKINIYEDLILNYFKLKYNIKIQIDLTKKKLFEVLVQFILGYYFHNI